MTVKLSEDALPHAQQLELRTRNGLPDPHYDDNPLCDFSGRIAHLTQRELKALQQFEREHDNRLAIIQIIGNTLAALHRSDK